MFGPAIFNLGTKGCFIASFISIDSAEDCSKIYSRVNAITVIITIQTVFQAMVELWGRVTQGFLIFFHIIACVPFYFILVTIRFMWFGTHIYCSTVLKSPSSFFFFSQFNHWFSIIMFKIAFSHRNKFSCQSPSLNTILWESCCGIHNTRRTTTYYWLFSCQTGWFLACKSSFTTLLMFALLLWQPFSSQTCF